MSFHPKTYAEALEQHKPLSRKAAIARPVRSAENGAGIASNSTLRPARGPQRRKQGINKRGVKTKAWEAERARLKKRFAAVGILVCELRYAGCAFDNYLGFAHAEKRRSLSAETLSVVILACNFCHDKIETDPRMSEIVMATITARPKQP